MGRVFGSRTALHETGPVRRAGQPPLQGMQDALAEQGKAGFAVHGSFEELEFGDEAFDHPIVLGQSESSHHCRFVAVHSQNKALELASSLKLVNEQQVGSW